MGDDADQVAKIEGDNRALIAAKGEPLSQSLQGSICLVFLSKRHA